ncbi:MAG: hypothetical protein M1839_000232 [Geoglossum umbratile]|nr:MAG: hypothetical protein M1839_000232 [Geoglossum umbratile]
MTGGTITGVVVSAGKMMKTVKVRVASQVWNNHIRKHFTRPVNHLVHDPSSSLCEGDIVRIARGWRTSKHKRHIATEVVAAFGTGLRPPLPRLEDLAVERERQREEKRKRRAARAMGLLGENGGDHKGTSIKEARSEGTR